MEVIQLAFPEGKRKAFTMSYDDGVQQDKKLLGLMHRYGIKGTFNLNSGRLDRQQYTNIDGIETNISTCSAEEIVQIYNEQEIACHGVKHLKLTDIPTGMVAQEIMSDRCYLEDLTKALITGFAYPFGVYSDAVIETLRYCGIQYARTVKNTGTYQLPTDFLKWHPTCHHNDPGLMNLLNEFCQGEEIFGASRLFYLWGHSYEFDQKENWDVIEKVFEKLYKYKSYIWMATNKDIYMYVSAFKQLIFSAEGNIVYNPTSTILWMLVDKQVVKVLPGETTYLK